MAEETVYALTDADGVVINRIVADAAYIKELGAQIADPDVDSGDLTFAKAYDVTSKDVGIGYRRASNGQWVRPEPTPEQIEVQERVEAEAAARAEDDEFVAAMKEKARAKQSFTQDERDRLQAIDLSRR